MIVTVKHDSLRTDNRISLLGFLSASRKNWSQSVTESMLLSLTAMAIHVPHDITFTSNLLWIVMTELGNENIFLRAVAVEQLRSFASQKTPSIFDGFKPFMEKLSVLLINSLEVNPRIIREFVHLIGIDIKAFIGFGREFILPDLVLSKKSAVLRQVAEWLQQDLHQILLDDAGPILAHVLLNSNGNFDDAMKFYVGSTSLESIPVGKLLKSCLLSLLSKLVLALGDTKKQNMALKVIEFVVFQVQAGASQREPLAAFLLKHLLGIIPPINSILYLKGCLHLTPKLKALLALQKLIMTIGAPIISALPQLTAVIQGVLETSDTRTAALECWRSLISTLDKGALAPFLNQLVVISCQYSEEYDLHQEAIVKDILDYLLVKSAGHFSEQLETIFELPVRFSSFQPQLESTSDDLNWSSELQNDIKWLNHESQPVVRKALEQIRNTLQRNELLVLKSLAGEHVDHTLILLINKLLEVCRRQSDDLILALCCQCLGIVGAVDPGRLEAEKNLNAKCYHVSYAGNAIEFSCYLIRTRLASEYIACSDLSLQSLLAFTIQELLKFIGFSRSMEVVTCLNGVKKISMGGDQSLQSKWDKFSARTMDILTPLLTSRYSIKDTRKVTTPLPIYEYTTCETEWVATLMVHTIQNLSGVSDFHRVLNLVSTLVKESDVNLREDLFPVVVLQGILDVSSNNLDTICQDFLFALEDADQGSKHKRIKTNQVILGASFDMSRSSKSKGYILRH